MKVIDVEQVYLGYTAHWSIGKLAANQHTEIEMGAKEKGKGGDVRCCKLRLMGGRSILRASVKVDGEEAWGNQGERFVSTKAGRMSEDLGELICILRYCNEEKSQALFKVIFLKTYCFPFLTSDMIDYNCCN